MSGAGTTVQWGVVLDDRGSTELHPEAVARSIAERDACQLVRVTTEIMPTGPADGMRNPTDAEDTRLDAATRSPIRALTETLAETPAPAVSAHAAYARGYTDGVDDRDWGQYTLSSCDRENPYPAEAMPAAPTLAEFEAHLRRVYASAHLPEDAALARQALDTVINFRAEHGRIANVPRSKLWFPEHDVTDVEYLRFFDAEVARLSASPEPKPKPKPNGNVSPDPAPQHTPEVPAENRSKETK